MKVKSILAAAIVLTGSVTLAIGQDNNKLEVIRGKESGIFKVIYEGEGQVKATVNVLDREGNLVYTKYVKGGNGFHLPMDFKDLGSGEYQIEVKEGSDTWTKTILYTAQSRKNSSIQNVAVSKLKDSGKYLLSIAKSGGEAVTISVFNENDYLLHTETIKADRDVAVVYDVKGISGMSKFQITDKAGYSKVIKK